LKAREKFLKKKSRDIWETIGHSRNVGARREEDEETLRLSKGEGKGEY